MKATITIELTREHTADSGSGLPAMGHTAYRLKKQLAKVEYKDTNGVTRKLVDEYPVSKITIEAG